MSSFLISRGIPDKQRAAAAALYWQAFGAKLGRVLGPEDSGRAFFERTLDGRYAYCALDGRGRVLGLAGFRTGTGSLTGGGLGDLAQVYGWWGAFWRAALLSLLERELAPGIMLMDGICVAAGARGQGIGGALLDRIVTHAADKGLAAVRLDVIDSNPRARALYERKGFVAGRETRLGPLRNVFGFRRATEMYRAISRAPAFCDP